MNRCCVEHEDYWDVGEGWMGARLVSYQREGLAGILADGWVIGWVKTLDYEWDALVSSLVDTLACT